MTRNLFAYCANNPVMYFDPDGRSLLGALLGAIVGGVVGAIVGGVVGAAVGAVVGAVIGKAVSGGGSGGGGSGGGSGYDSGGGGSGGSDESSGPMPGYRGSYGRSGAELTPLKPPCEYCKSTIAKPVGTICSQIAVPCSNNAADCLSEERGLNISLKCLNPECGNTDPTNEVFFEIHTGSGCPKDPQIVRINNMEAQWFWDFYFPEFEYKLREEDPEVVPSGI